MRRSNAGMGAEEEENEINLTPMLDVVFIMLIFFIVTASFIPGAGYRHHPKHLDGPHGYGDRHDQGVWGDGGIRLRECAGDGCRCLAGDRADNGRHGWRAVRRSSRHFA